MDDLTLLQTVYAYLEEQGIQGLPPVINCTIVPEFIIGFGGQKDASNWRQAHATVTITANNATIGLFVIIEANYTYRTKTTKINIEDPNSLPTIYEIIKDLADSYTQK